MRFPREQYLDLITFGPCERPMFVELFGLLIGVDEEWRAQGASEDELDMTAFDWDYVDRAGCGARVGPIGGREEEILEETDEYIIKRDYLGRTTKLCKGMATIALPLDFPVKTIDDWLRLKPMYVFREDRIDWEEVEKAKLAQAEGALVVGRILGGFDTARELMGEEVACLAYYQQPELMRDILDTLLDTAVRVYERITSKLTLDCLSVHEDLAGKSGSLVGPKQILEFIKPYYRGVWGLVSARGARVFQQDSDGNLDGVLDAFIECGVNCSLPMEPAAGMDIVAVRKKYGSGLAVMGGIDKHVIRRSREEIRSELEHKMQPLMRESGTVFSLDHRIPNGTPIENYRYYVSLGREILGLPPFDPDRKGWARMAF